MTPSTISACDSTEVTFSVLNTGEIVGDEVTMVYLAPPKRSDKPFFPNLQLIDFGRSTTTPGIVMKVFIELYPYLFSLVDEDGERYIFPGDYMVLTGHQPGDDMLKATFTITGSAPVKVSTCTSSPQCLAC